MIIFDIETGPLPDDLLFERIGEFQPKPHPGVFDPSLVKHGLTKDESKRKAKEDELRYKHDAAVAAYEQETREAAIAYANAARDRAPLDPTTGSIVAIGYLGVTAGAEPKIRIDGVGDMGSADPMAAQSPRTERDLLVSFWQMFQKALASNRTLVGHNILEFDMPFIARRSWILDVGVPLAATSKNSPLIADLMKIWLCGARWGSVEANLNHIAKMLGVGEKNGNGADFARLWHGAPEERQQARAYLVNDLTMTYHVARRMGVVNV